MNWFRPADGDYVRLFFRMLAGLLLFLTAIDFTAAQEWTQASEAGPPAAGWTAGLNSFPHADAQYGGEIAGFSVDGGDFDVVYRSYRLVELDEWGTSFIANASHRYGGDRDIRFVVRFYISQSTSPYGTGSQELDSFTWVGGADEGTYPGNGQGSGSFSLPAADPDPQAVWWVHCVVEAHNDNNFSDDSAHIDWVSILEDAPLDTDGDGDPDETDPDDDGDDCPDVDDPEPLNPAVGCDGGGDESDSDGDGIPDDADPDDDNDDCPDEYDPDPTDPSVACTDTDGDGDPDYSDPNDDGDDCPDECDPYPLSPGTECDCTQEEIDNLFNPPLFTTDCGSYTPGWDSLLVKVTVLFNLSAASVSATDQVLSIPVPWIDGGQRTYQLNLLPENMAVESEVRTALENLRQAVLALCKVLIGWRTLRALIKVLFLVK